VLKRLPRKIRMNMNKLAKHGQDFTIHELQFMSNSSISTFAMGSFINVCNLWFENALCISRYI
jgi:hypothetical protein